MISQPIRDLRTIMALVMSGGPRGVAEQRIMQTRLTNVMKALQTLADQPDQSEEVEDLEAANRDLMDQLNAANTANGLGLAEIKTLRQELRQARSKITRLSTKKDKITHETS